ncbi:hypothetical protein HMPREF1531_00828 [Propionibacterium sp. oral taxon 192 str. F0372]|mgnify:CR=1 FL=1|uniref:ABC transporter permease n=1 Tax=Propionibacterium sp. oral taxon 192 TaxID=671222 RepID=UPI0003532847|nr:ABC transporter permease [Propionibacterium sp. oral taxon 192]EPH06179.1 hypothetical protein HMPREF1531_00828 [Propionibacterium sp. oral taxon 192 str. F0372]
MTRYLEEPKKNLAVTRWIQDVFELVVLDIRQFFANKLFTVSTFLTSVSMVLSFGAATRQMNSPTGDASSFFGFVFPGILACGVMFACTYTIGYTIIIDRSRRTIEDLILSPLSYSGFLVARLIGVLFKCLLQFVTVFIIGILFFEARVSSWPLLFLALFSGSFFFAGLGTFVACFTNEISFPAVINIIVIPIMYFAGIFYPLTNLDWVGEIMARLPLSAHVEIFRAALGQGPSPSMLTLIVAVFYGIAAVAVAAYTFRRSIGRV